MKRDYIAFMPKPDVPTAMRNLAIAFEHYNEFHPHSVLGYRTPREVRRRTGSSFKGEGVSGDTGADPRSLWSSH
jgi:transposase InsO family protein